jgi:hypothetical protein
MTQVVRMPIRPLDRPITYTQFRDLTAETKREISLRQFREITDGIAQVQAKQKILLPLWKFARFGKRRTSKLSLRHDPNVLGIVAIEGDHDAGTMEIEDATKLLREAIVAAMLHTTPSQEPGKPRWRVICPTAGELPPDRHKPLVARLNGILGGTLTSESFALSQSYYYGHVKGKEYTTLLVDGSRTIDEATELDGGAIHRNRDRDDTRSGDAARLAHQIKIVNRGTFWDFIEAVHDDQDLSLWWWENEEKQPGGGNRQLSRAWRLIKAPPDYDDVFDCWTPTGRFQLTRFRDIKLGPQRRYVVRGLIPREGLVVVWGPPKCGKSFSVTDLGLRVSLGQNYRGRRVEQGPVIYVACEGQAGVPQRIEAFKQTQLAENPEADPPFFLLPTQLNLIGEVKKLIEEIRAQLGAEAPIMVVLDTLNRSLAGQRIERSGYVGLYRRVRGNSTGV